MKRSTSFVFFIALLAIVPMAPAALIPFTAALDGAQAGTPSLATGTAVITYDDVAHTLDWVITYDAGALINGAGSVTVAHFHRVTDKGVDLGIPTGSNPFVATGVALTAAQEANLLAGNWYVNIHTTAYPAGEIAGLVIPEPFSVITLTLGALFLGFRRRRV